jgi:hypothetical protein
MKAGARRPLAAILANFRVALFEDNGRADRLDRTYSLKANFLLPGPKSASGSVD